MKLLCIGMAGFVFFIERIIECSFLSVLRLVLI